MMANNPGPHARDVRWRDRRMGYGESDSEWDEQASARLPEMRRQAGLDGPRNSNSVRELFAEEDRRRRERHARQMRQSTARGSNDPPPPVTRAETTVEIDSDHLPDFDDDGVDPVRQEREDRLYAERLHRQELERAQRRRDRRPRERDDSPLPTPWVRSAFAGAYDDPTDSVRRSAGANRDRPFEPFSGNPRTLG